MLSSKFCSGACSTDYKLFLYSGLFFFKTTFGSSRKMAGKVLFGL